MGHPIGVVALFIEIRKVSATVSGESEKVALLPPRSRQNSVSSVAAWRSLFTLSSA